MVFFNALGILAVIWLTLLLQACGFEHMCVRVCVGRGGGGIFAIIEIYF